MKGSLHTDEFMGAVVGEEKLRTARRMSHVSAIDAPYYPRSLFVTDAAINIYPTVEEKADIVQDAIGLRTPSPGLPKVAILSAVETVRRRSSPRSMQQSCAKWQTEADHRRHPRWPARLRQCGLRGSREGQGYRFSCCRPSGHLRRARPRYGEYAGEAARVLGEGSDCGHRARFAGANRPDQPRRQDASEAGILRDRSATRTLKDTGA